MSNEMFEETIRFYRQRSLETLNEAKILAQQNAWNGTANRLYYASFYIVVALMMSKGIRVKSHKDLKELFHLHFVKSGILDSQYSKLYSTLFNLRNDGDYGDFIVYTNEQIEPVLFDTEKFIEIIINLI